MPSPSSLIVRSTRSGACYGAAFAPDGQSIACVGRNVVMWETARKRRVASSHPLSNPANVAFSPSGREVAVKNTSGECVVLDPASLAVVGNLGGAKFGEGSSVAFASDGALIDASWNGHLVGRDVQSGATIFLERSAAMISPLTRDLESDVFAYVATARGEKGTDTIYLRRWPFSENEPIALYEADGGRDVHSLALRGDRLAAAVGQEVRVFSTATGEVVARQEIGMRATGLAWFPDGDALLVAGGGRFGLYDAGLDEVWALERDYACAVAISADGSRVALATWTDSLISEPV